VIALSLEVSSSFFVLGPAQKHNNKQPHPLNQSRRPTHWMAGSSSSDAATAKEAEEKRTQDTNP
jgi:hypothetical protein